MRLLGANLGVFSQLVQPLLARVVDLPIFPAVTDVPSTYISVDRRRQCIADSHGPPP